MGYFSYDLGRRIETVPQHASNDLEIPDMAVGLYNWAVVVDHHKRRSWLVGDDAPEFGNTHWKELIDLLHSEQQSDSQDFAAISEIESNMSNAEYASSFDAIKRYIREGDCYQVNLTQRFSVDVKGQSWDIYQQLRKNNPAPFSAYFNAPDACILSSSPERFLNVTNGNVETKPIKGTIRRSADSAEDKSLAAELLESTKDRAENLMIVDLMRNDLSKNCETGSVTVPKLFELESYTTVHHLVSTIVGRLRSNRHTLELLRDCFPGGSITGTPKLRAMQIIEELEPTRRNIYCGSIGYIGFDGNMDTNIAIRTMAHLDNRIVCWAGGGIVEDSNLESEYQEALQKVSAMLKLFDKNVNSDFEVNKAN